MAAEPFNLDARRMIATQTAPGGVINRETRFTFSQNGQTVEARYAGGRVKLGQLVGRIDRDTFEFRYAQLHEDDTLHGGHSRCQLQREPNGKIRIVEHYEWANGQTGTNVIEEA